MFKRKYKKQESLFIVCLVISIGLYVAINWGVRFSAIPLIAFLLLIWYGLEIKNMRIKELEYKD